jgi:hypothetical protein
MQVTIHHGQGWKTPVPRLRLAGTAPNRKPGDIEQPNQVSTKWKMVDYVGVNNMLK